MRFWLVTKAYPLPSSIKNFFMFWIRHSSRSFSMYSLFSGKFRNSRIVGFLMNSN